MLQRFHNCTAAECAFCGKQKPDLFVGKDSNAYICDECVSDVTEMVCEQPTEGEQHEE